MITGIQEHFMEQLYLDMYVPLSAYAQSALRDKSLAEEAVQDAFRIACSKVETLMESPNSAGWMMNTLKNVIQNMKRSRARLNQLIIGAIEFDENITGVTADEVDPELLYGGIVDKEEYHLLKIIAIDGYSLKEVADELGIAVEACKKRYQRAKKKFREKLELGT